MEEGGTDRLTDLYIYTQHHLLFSSLSQLFDSLHELMSLFFPLLCSDLFFVLDTISRWGCLMEVW